MSRRALDPAGTCVACGVGHDLSPGSPPRSLVQQLLASGYVSRLTTRRSELSRHASGPRSRQPGPRRRSDVGRARNHRGHAATFVNVEVDVLWG